MDRRGMLFVAGSDSRFEESDLRREKLTIDGIERGAACRQRHTKPALYSLRYSLRHRGRRHQSSSGETPCPPPLRQVIGISQTTTEGRTDRDAPAASSCLVSTRDTSKTIQTSDSSTSVIVLTSTDSASPGTQLCKLSTVSRARGTNCGTVSPVEQCIIS